MIFSLIRWIFVIGIFVICYIFIKKSKMLHKRKWVILSGFLTLFLAFLSTLGPIENAFITFPTVESAYYYSKEGYIKHIIQGNESDFVIGQKDNDTSNILAVMPKNNDGWKIPSFGSLKRVTSTISHDVSIQVYQYKNSDDYYIMVHCLNSNTLKLTDNRGSKFEYFEGKNRVNQTYCTYIHCFDENYVITVDGNPISFDNII